MCKSNVEVPIPYPYMGRRPGAPDKLAQDQITSIVDEINREDAELKRRRQILINQGGFPLGAKITGVPEQDQKGPPKPIPLSKKGSTG